MIALLLCEGGCLQRKCLQFEGFLKLCSSLGLGPTNASGGPGTRYSSVPGLLCLCSEVLTPFDPSHLAALDHQTFENLVVQE